MSSCTTVCIGHRRYQRVKGDVVLQVPLHDPMTLISSITVQHDAQCSTKTRSKECCNSIYSFFIYIHTSHEYGICRMCMLPNSYIVYALVISIPLSYLLVRHSHSRPSPPKSASQSKPIMQPARTDLAPPKNDPFTTAELAQYDGSDASKPIYVAIKGA